MGQLDLRDRALPTLARLLDAGDVAPALARTLGEDLDPSAIGIRYLRYRPGRRLLVRYEVETPRGTLDVVALADATADLPALPARPENVALARAAAPRCPAEVPLSYDHGLGALLVWPPADVAMPALAQPAGAWRVLLKAAGVETAGAGDELRTLKYKPLQRAVLRLDDHIIRVHGDEDAFRRAVDGIRAARSLPLPTARCEAVLPAERIEVQSVVPGVRPPAPEEVAERAGAVLRTIHTADLPGLRPVPAESRLADTADAARLLGAVVPGLAPRLTLLLDRLGRTAPQTPLVPSHGGFHVSQLLDADGELGVVDFDGACRAPAALDLASYAVSVVRGRGDLDRACATLDALSAGYGRRPEGLGWYLCTLLLRRARLPFTRLRAGWPEEVESRVDAAGAALELT